MLSAENLAIIKLATIICNTKDLKRDILCVVGTDCYFERESYESGLNIDMWNKTIEKKSKIILNSVGLPEELQDKVAGIILSIGRKMLSLSKLYEEILISDDYAVNFFNIDCFTQRGTIDNVKVSQEFINDPNLSVAQKFMLAKLHYRTGADIKSLYRDMNNDDKELYDKYTSEMRMLTFVDEFTSLLILIPGTKDTAESAVARSVESGCVEAVKNFLQLIDFRDDYDDKVLSLVDLALQITEDIDEEWGDYISKELIIGLINWTPLDYFLDIICLLLPNMNQDQVANLFRSFQDVFDDNYQLFDDGDNDGLLKYVNIFKYFLNWPYQDYFMKMVSLMWEFLPKGMLCDLLIKICEKIEPGTYEITYGEEKNFDYRGLLREFWCESPKDFRRYIFSQSSSIYDKKLGKMIQTGTAVLATLLKLKCFTYKDGEVIRLIFATDQNKESICFWNDGIWNRNQEIWIRFMEQEERGDIFNRLMLYCFHNKEEADKFKRKFIYEYFVQSVCVQFLLEKKCAAVDCFMQQISLPEEEMKKLKKALGFSDIAKYKCVEFFIEKNYAAIDCFIDWLSLPMEEIKELKKSLGFSDAAKEIYVDFAAEGNWNEMKLIFNWCCLSEEEIEKVKKEAIYSDYGKRICRDLSRESVERAKQFCEMLLSSEVEIRNFRKVLIDCNEETCLSLLRDDREFLSDLISFCILSEDDLNIFKNALYSNVGKEKCRRMCLIEGVESAEKFCKMFFSAEEEMRQFRMDLIFTEGFSKNDCAELVLDFNIDIVSNFLKFCFISENNLKEVKECVASDHAIRVCKSLISHSGRVEILGIVDADNHNIGGIDWAEVEQFLTWCFPSEEEIKKFKKNVLFPSEGASIHFNLIKFNEWAEAVTFFSWLELSSEEVKQVMKNTLFDKKIFFYISILLHFNDYAISRYGGQEDTMELFLMWFLNDQEVDFEVIDKLKKLFRPSKNRELFANFEKILEQHLMNLNNCKLYTKR